VKKIQLNTNLAIRNLPNNKFVVSLDAIISKKIPIIAKTRFTYKDGFRSLDSLKIEPDSVVVSGPASYLDKMNFVETILISKDNIDKALSQSVMLIGKENKRVSIDPMEVHISLHVAEFTQKKMVVPIELTNVPEETIVKLIPRTVTVTFNVSVEDFNQIAASDFKLVCDFNERNFDEDFILLKLEKGPPRIYNIELSTKKIDYLIFK
jgi:YbbR domain-containing protein